MEFFYVKGKDEYYMNVKYSSWICYFSIAWNMLSFGIYNSMFLFTYPDSRAMVGRLVALFRLVLGILAVAHLYKKRMSVKDIAHMVVLCGVILLNYLVSDSWLLFSTFFIPFVFCDVLDYKKVINCFFYSLLFTAIVTVCLYFADGFTEYIFLRNNSEIRHHLGFNHPNALGKTVMCLVILFFLKQDNRLNIGGVCLLLITAAWIYVVPNSITSAATVVLFAAFKLFFDYVQGRCRNKTAGIILSVLPIIVAVLVYCIIYTGFLTEIISSISGTFMSRFRFGRQALDEYGVSLFGQNIKFTTELTIGLLGSQETYFTIDCLYVYMPVVAGIVPSALFLYYYIRCSERCYWTENTTMLAALCAMTVYSVMETSITGFMFSFLFWGPICYKKEQSGKTFGIV